MIVADKITSSSGYDLYLRREVYGTTGSNDKIYLGKGDQFDSSNYFMFCGSAGLYNKMVNDTLKVYTTKISHLPTKLNLEKVVIDQILLNYSKMLELHKAQANYGLKSLEVPLKK